MNRLKSVFISVYMMIVFAFLIMNALEVAQGNTPLLHGVSMAIHFIILFLFGKLLIMRDTARTSKNLTGYTILITSLFIVFLGLSYFQYGIIPNLLIFNVASIVGWLVYLKWYSVFPNRDNDRLKVGQLLPDLNFENIEGEMISTENFKGSRIIYLFYRGNWCPLCMAQIKEIAAQYQQLSDRGVKIALISPQPQGHTKSLAKKFEVPFIFLKDVDHASAKQLNIFQGSGTPLGMELFGYESDTVMPTVIICDEEGKIIFADLTDNYRIRPEPETFLRALDA